jgi:hypothetical protein
MTGNRQLGDGIELVKEDIFWPEGQWSNPDNSLTVIATESRLDSSRRDLPSLAAPTLFQATKWRNWGERFAPTKFAARRVRSGRCGLFKRPLLIPTGLVFFTGRCVESSQEP